MNNTPVFKFFTEEFTVSLTMNIFKSLPIRSLNSS